MKKLIQHQKLGFVATVSADNTPNLSPKGTISVWDNEHLIFADIKSPKTIENLRKNSSLEVNVVDPIKRRGFRFKGTASIITKGEQYDKMCAHYKEQGVKSQINAVVLIKIESANEIKSPLYDLGYSEKEISTKWKKYYFTI